MSGAFTPVVLEGREVRLEPMSPGHLPGLVAVGLDPSLWAVGMQSIRSADDMAAYVASALADQAAGHALPFVTVAREDGSVVGSTRLGAWVPAFRRVEIGWTWIAPRWQRSAINTEAKLLMLTHAFETLGCVRVELKTDVLNLRSRAAILRLGAVEEGVLRKHQITATGRIRDSVLFSITDEEWPGVRERLRSMTENREPRAGA